MSTKKFKCDNNVDAPANCHPLPHPLPLLPQPPHPLTLYHPLYQNPVKASDINIIHNNNTNGTYLVVVLAQPAYPALKVCRCDVIKKWAYLVIWGRISLDNPLGKGDCIHKVEWLVKNCLGWLRQYLRQELCMITLLTGINSVLRWATGPWGTTPASTGVVGVGVVRVGSPAANRGIIANGTLPMKLSPHESSVGGPSTHVPEVAHDLVLQVWECKDLGGDIVWLRE